MSIFNRECIAVHKEEDVLIICQRKPILIGKWDERGRYRIPLKQSHRQWQPRKPTQNSKNHLQQANSVYDLPPTEEAIKWIHAVFGYPVKSTWIKDTEAGNCTGWPMMNGLNVAKYCPDTTKTLNGHLHQSRKKVRSTKPKPTPLEVTNTSTLRGRKVHNVYTSVYKVRNTVFTN